jgi:hypothetical protein
VLNGLLVGTGEVGTLPDGSLNLDAIRLTPLLDNDNELLTDLLHANLDPTTGLPADPNPPYKLYRQPQPDRTTRRPARQRAVNVTPLPPP